MKKTIIMLLLSLVTLNALASANFQQDTVKKAKPKTKQKQQKRDSTRTDTSHRDTSRPTTPTKP